jgi:large subunit ribosomal protein L24e
MGIFKKLEIDSFTNYKIYPSKGRLFIRGDSKVSVMTSPLIYGLYDPTTGFFQIFRFGTSKSESLFLQRKNPRKIAWTVLYRRMHKKGITEEVAKKRSRRTVKHQRGIVGADLTAIAAKRGQSAQVRTAQRIAAISKAKAEKKEKEAKKPKVRFPASHLHGNDLTWLQPQRPSVPGANLKNISKQQAKGGRGGR